eukprot:TRINITY_DN80_c0_g3_i1.p2 TRINITY_DN80_c0_g3~~TRINITY_DN80_c0_g3_i1.p2  ORF type:complete len:118 (-),score=5.96 TRINITY_DN80_c0_g3_i1:584-937(-)
MGISICHPSNFDFRASMRSRFTILMVLRPVLKKRSLVIKKAGVLGGKHKVIELAFPSKMEIWLAGQKGIASGVPGRPRRGPVITPNNDSTYKHQEASLLLINGEIYPRGLAEDTFQK